MQQNISDELQCIDCNDDLQGTQPDYRFLRLKSPDDYIVQLEVYDMLEYHIMISLASVIKAVK